MTPLEKSTEQTELHLSSRGYHAVAALVLLARLSESGPVRLATLTRPGTLEEERDGSVSQSYLEQLFAKLRRADIVKSTRGPGGGYSLARPARDISLADIFIATASSETAENTAGNMADASLSALHHVRGYVDGAVYETLSRRTLADVLRHFRAP